MNAYGDSSVLKYQERPIPSLRADEVLVKVAASAINRADLEVRSGKWVIESENPFPYVPGVEFCGVVENVGDDVDLPVGTPVITMMQKMAGIHGQRDGGYQSHVVALASTLAVVPEGVDLIHLSAVGLAGVTAYHGMGKLHLSKGHSVIVLGASGGVGSVALKLGLKLGCHVIAVTHKSRDVDKLLKLGASEVWDLSKRSLKDWCANKVDAVLEMVGGDVFADAVSCLKKGGHLCSIGAITGGPAHLSIWDLLHEIHLTGWSSENMNQKGLQCAVDTLAELLKSGELEPPPYTEYPLSQVAQAHQDMEDGKTFGRVLLIP